jgi:hypothetical protein
MLYFCVYVQFHCCSDIFEFLVETCIAWCILYCILHLFTSKCHCLFPLAHGFWIVAVTLSTVAFCFTWFFWSCSPDFHLDVTRICCSALLFWLIWALFGSRCIHLHTSSAYSSLYQIINMYTSLGILVCPWPLCPFLGSTVYAMLNWTWYIAFIHFPFVSYLWFGLVKFLCWCSCVCTLFYLFVHGTFLFPAHVQMYIWVMIHALELNPVFGFDLVFVCELSLCTFGFAFMSSKLDLCSFWLLSVFNGYIITVVARQCTQAWTAATRYSLGTSSL